MADRPRRWEPDSRNEAYADLDHPADVFLEIWGDDLSVVFENALFALYDHIAELAGFGTGHEEVITVEGPDAAGALRSLLAEALYLFSTEGFVAARAEIDVQTRPAGEVGVTARLDGEIVDRRRHTLFTEVKAVTYHQLTVEKTAEGGWRATVLLDV